MGAHATLTKPNSSPFRSYANTSTNTNSYHDPTLNLDMDASGYSNSRVSPLNNASSKDKKVSCQLSGPQKKRFTSQHCPPSQTTGAANPPPQSLQARSRTARSAKSSLTSIPSSPRSAKSLASPSTDSVLSTVTSQDSVISTDDSPIDLLGVGSGAGGAGAPPRRIGATSPVPRRGLVRSKPVIRRGGQQGVNWLAPGTVFSVDQRVVRAKDRIAYTEVRAYLGLICSDVYPAAQWHLKFHAEIHICALTGTPTGARSVPSDCQPRR